MIAVRAACYGELVGISAFTTRNEIVHVDSSICIAYLKIGRLRMPNALPDANCCKLARHLCLVCGSST